MNWKRLLLLATLLAGMLLAGCEKSPNLTPLPADAVILAFGDSLTYGTGAVGDESYPAALSRLLQREVVNAGVPGEVSAAGLARLPELLEEYRPALVILCHGGNDFLRRLDKEKLAGNLRQMAGLAREAGAEVVLVGVPQLGLLLSTDPLYAEVAEELRLPYEGEVLSDLLSDREFKSDQIHPNARGYAVMAEKIAEVIREAGGL
ncbi:arylesterase [Trichloromonas sp.]|uniref:arylesterase n=1 Tax=Trichloromonas sp. TaxID=3069249 RepID=UPI003D813C5A